MIAVKIPNHKTILCCEKGCGTWFGDIDMAIEHDNIIHPKREAVVNG